MSMRNSKIYLKKREMIICLCIWAIPGPKPLGFEYFLWVRQWVQGLGFLYSQDSLNQLEELLGESVRMWAQQDT